MLVESSCSYGASICCTAIALWCVRCGQSGKRRGGQQPCHEGNFTPLGGISPSAAVQERGCPANPPQPRQDCRPWPLTAPPRVHPRGAAEFKPGLAPCPAPAPAVHSGVPSSAEDSLWHSGQVAGAEQVTFFRHAGSFRSACRGCPLVPALLPL